MPGYVNQMIVELGPRVVERPHVHRLVVVLEMEREGQHSPGALIVEIHRRHAAERGEERVGRERARREVDEILGELEGLGAFVAVEPQHEVRLDVRDVAKDQVYMLGDLLDLVHPRVAGLRLVAQREPRLDAGQQCLEAVPA
jgi:hypothetical protein